MLDNKKIYGIVYNYNMSLETRSNPLKVPSYARLGAEVMAALALNLASTAILNVNVLNHINLSSIVDYAAIAIPLVETPFSLNKIRKMKKQGPPKVHFPIRENIWNWIFKSKTMDKRVGNWESKKDYEYGKELRKSEKREKRDKIRIVGFPAIVGVGRVGLMALDNIPHAGEGFGAFNVEYHTALSHPDMFFKAFDQFMQNPPAQGLLATGLVVGASFLGSIVNYSIQKIVSNRIREKLILVNDAATTHRRR